MAKEKEVIKIDAKDTFRIKGQAVCYWTNLPCAFDCRRCTVGIVQAMNGMIYGMNQMLAKNNAEVGEKFNGEISS